MDSRSNTLNCRSIILKCSRMWSMEVKFLVSFPSVIFNMKCRMIFFSTHRDKYIFKPHTLYFDFTKNRLVIKVSPQSWDEKSFISNSSSDSGFPWGTFRETENLDRASLIAQLVKNLPAMEETQVQFLGQEDPLEKGMATHSSILGLSLWLSW